MGLSAAMVQAKSDLRSLSPNVVKGERTCSRPCIETILLPAVDESRACLLDPRAFAIQLDACESTLRGSARDSRRASLFAPSSTKRLVVVVSLLCHQMPMLLPSIVLEARCATGCAFLLSVVGDRQRAREIFPRVASL